MSMLSWNLRGLGNHRSVQVLKDLLHFKRPKIVFVMETKINGARLNYICDVLGFNNFFAVDSIGLSGGLGLFWNDNMV